MSKKKQSGLSDAAAKLGKKGGTFGGPARAKALTPAERTAIAKEGGKARQKQKRTGG